MQSERVVFEEEMFRAESAIVADDVLHTSQRCEKKLSVAALKWRHTRHTVSAPSVDTQQEDLEMPAYREFKAIVYGKLRLFGVCFGLDILQPDFRPNYLTAITVFAVTFTFGLCVTTMFYCDDDDMSAGATACSRLALKVKPTPSKLK